MMSDVIKTISSPEEFLAIDFNNPPAAIIFEETLSFPLFPGKVLCDYDTFTNNLSEGISYLCKGLKTVNSFPQKYREVYFHPQYYGVGVFRKDVVTLMRNQLRRYLGNGGFLICRVSPTYEDSVFNVCSLLGHYYWECHNKRKKRSSMRDITLVPFPYRITRGSLNGLFFPYQKEDDKWIWIARWIPTEPEICHKELDIITEGDDDFPPYDDECFPVVKLDECNLEKNKVGTIAFAVEMGDGAIIVAPSSMDLSQIKPCLIRTDKASSPYGIDILADIVKKVRKQAPVRNPDAYNLTVNNFPRLINLNKTQGETLINKKIKINDLAFLRFLVLLHVSQFGDLAYDTTSNVFRVINDQEEDLPLKSIFKKKGLDGFPANIATLIDKILELLKIPKANILKSKDRFGNRIRLLNVTLTFDEGVKHDFNNATVIENSTLAKVVKHRFSEITELLS